MRQFDFRSTPLLLIGRDPDMLGLLREVLLDSGFFVIARLSDGFLLNLDSSQDQPSLILYDEAQPEVDAERVFYLLQDAPRWRDIPFMILSDINDGTRVARCLDRGVAEFVAKPFDVVELAARVRKILREAMEDAQQSSEVEVEGFAGDLSYMNLSDLLLNLHQNVRTGELHVTMQEGEYVFWLHQGKLVKVLGPARIGGRKALYRAIRLFYGKFTFTPSESDAPPADARDFGPLPNLILQSVQESDEFPLIRQKLPEDPVQVRIANQEAASRVLAGEDKILRPLLQSEGRRATIDQLILASADSDLDAAQQLYDLLVAGSIIIT